MPDVNVLVYAHRPDERVHDFYRNWLESVVAGPEPFALSVLVMAGFVRIVTRPGLFDEPTPLTVALATIEALREQEGCRIVGPGSDHPSLFDRCCRAARAAGKLVADAQHAAVAIEHGCEWVTRDRDFGRFQAAGLRWTHLQP